jgi:hypothetical protein
MNLLNIFNKNSIYSSLFLSICAYCINFLIKFILLNVHDYYLFFIDNKIIYNNNINSDSESDSDSESESDSNSNSDSDSKLNKEINNKLLLDNKKEYLKILELFNTTKSINITYLYKKLYVNNTNIYNNEFYIINVFLFNFTNEENIIDLKNIFPFTKKLIILQKINKKLNTQFIENLDLNYKYIYILYKNHKSDYKYLIIDLYNNMNIETNKKLLFNNIKL